MKGEAARVLAGLPLTNLNYTHSVALLKDRYGQPHRIVNAHVQSLVELSKPSTHDQEERDSGRLKTLQCHLLTVTRLTISSYKRIAAATYLDYLTVLIVLAFPGRQSTLPYQTILRYARNVLDLWLTVLASLLRCCSHTTKSFRATEQRLHQACH